MRGAYGPYAEMPPVNRRNPNGGHARRNPAPESVNYDHLSDAQLTFLSNTGDEHASHELARRNPLSPRKQEERRHKQEERRRKAALVRAARTSPEREAEEAQFAQDRADALARFKPEDWRREVERDAYLYNPRSRR